MAYGHSSGLLPQQAAAPIMITEKLKPFFPMSGNITYWGVNPDQQSQAVHVGLG